MIYLGLLFVTMSQRSDDVLKVHDRIKQDV